VRELIGKAIPGALAASATQVNIFISGNLASHVPGGRTWLATADRLYQLPLGLVGVAIGVALLPRLSRAVNTGDGDDAQSAMDQAITLAMALTIPAAAALVAMPGFLSDALYTRGEFTSFDASQTASALFFYGLGTPAFVLQQLYSRAFFARGDTKSPMRFALISVAMNIGLGIVLFNLVGVKGIAAATAVSSWINVGQMAWGLSRKNHYSPSLADLVAGGADPGGQRRHGRGPGGGLALAAADRGAAAAMGLKRPRDRGQGVRPAADRAGRRGAVSAAGLPVRRGDAGGGEGRAAAGQGVEPGPCALGGFPTHRMRATPQGHVPGSRSCPPGPRPVTSVHGFDRFFRAAMAQLPLIRSAALSARLALSRPPCPLPVPRLKP
jgi:hypothetical protein